MDVPTLALCKSKLAGAEEATARATQAAEAAEQAIADIYHDKQLIFSVDPTDNHVVLTYYPNNSETEE